MLLFVAQLLSCAEGVTMANKAWESSAGVAALQFEQHVFQGTAWWQQPFNYSEHYFYSAPWQGLVHHGVRPPSDNDFNREPPINWARMARLYAVKSGSMNAHIGCGGARTCAISDSIETPWYAGMNCAARDEPDWTICLGFPGEGPGKEIVSSVATIILEAEQRHLERHLDGGSLWVLRAFRKKHSSNKMTIKPARFISDIFGLSWPSKAEAESDASFAAFKAALLEKPNWGEPKVSGKKRRATTKASNSSADAAPSPATKLTKEGKSDMRTFNGGDRKSVGFKQQRATFWRRAMLVAKRAGGGVLSEEVCHRV